MDRELIGALVVVEITHTHNPSSKTSMLPNCTIMAAIAEQANARKPPNMGEAALQVSKVSYIGN